VSADAATLAADHRETLMNLYRAFNQRDIDGVLEHLAPGVDWPNGWEGGRVHGRAEVRDYWTRQWAVINPRVEPLDIVTAADGKVRVRVDQLVRSVDGKILDNKQVEHVYEFEGPFITRMTIVDAARPADDEED
jgi:ketosteroid isomerase-like protein